MRGHISADWAFGICGAIENIARKQFPSDLRNLPLLQAFNFESYHIDEKYLIMVLQDKISGIPAGPDIPTLFSYTDYPALPLALRDVELWQAYLRNKFSLREEDAAIIIPLKDSDKDAPGDYALFSAEEQEVWNYQIYLTVARHKAHIEKPASNIPFIPTNITYIQGNMSENYINNLQNANIGNMANTVKDNACQQAIQNVHVSEQRQTLAEAAAEIQRLLKQLEGTNPVASEADQVAYVNIATELTLKQRVIAALRKGGETAIDEFVLENRYLKVIKAIVKGWLAPNG
jgi:hypothetical protein